MAIPAGGVYLLPPSATISLVATYDVVINGYYLALGAIPTPVESWSTT